MAVAGEPAAEHVSISTEFNIILLPEASPTIHMIMMAVLARPVVDLNFKGWQMAYHRSMEIDASVMTETVTETVCEKIKKPIIMKTYC